MANDDEQWLAALAGKGASGDGGPARAEAERIRVAMEISRAQVPIVPDLDVDAALRRFEAAARREGPMGDAVDESRSGSFASESSRGGSGQGRRRTSLWAGLSALLVALGTMLYIGSGPMLLGTRGSESLPPIYSADPRAAAKALRDDLAVTGASVKEDIIDAASGATRLTIDLGREARPGDAIDAVLEKHRVARVSGSRFVVEILPTKAP